MSEVNQIKLFVKSVYLKFKRIDILINNAGIQLNKKMEKVTQEDYLKVINNNLSSYYFFSNYAGKYMINKNQESLLTFLQSYQNFH